MERTRGHDMLSSVSSFFAPHEEARRRNVPRSSPDWESIPGAPRVDLLLVEMCLFCCKRKGKLDGSQMYSVTSFCSSLFCVGFSWLNGAV